MNRAIRRLLVAVGFSSGLSAVTASAAQAQLPLDHSESVMREGRREGRVGSSPGGRGAGARARRPSAGPPVPAAAVGVSPRPLLADIYQCASTQGNDSYRVPVAIAWGEPS
jgi:hypothetical protein